ncbi:MAG: hypothetical protein ACI9U2_002516 [Bradymonadia bacterium]|jgi:hypothetical protein
MGQPVTGRLRSGARRTGAMLSGLVLGSLLAPSAHAFQILTAASSPCHERLTAGGFGLQPAPFGTVAGLRVFDALLARAETAALPTDKATRSFIKDVGDTYGVAVDTPLEQWVVASIIAGAREPDTRGFAVVSFNELRTTHIKDDLQAPHSLRRANHDGEEGNESAIVAAREPLTQRLQEAHESFWSADPRLKTRWTFAFYGEVNVRVFEPAFRMGQMAHTLQDAFTHTLRNEDLEIVTVLNFVDASLGRLDEPVDGLNHSDRLDNCDTSNAFDRERIEAARDATASMMLAVSDVLAMQTLDAGPLDAVLDVSYAYAPGCTVDNEYCGTAWLAPARTALTGPVDISVCAASPGRAPAPLGWLGVLSVCAFGARRRRGLRRG